MFTKRTVQEDGPRLRDLCKSEANGMQILCKYTCGSPDCFFQWEGTLGKPLAWVTGNRMSREPPRFHLFSFPPPTRPIISICDYSYSQCFCHECVGLGLPIPLSLGVGWLVSPLSDWGVPEGK